jgi:hypothetical protein
MFVRNVFRNREEIFDWKLKKLCVRTVASYDSEYSASWAMSRVACAAEFTLTTPGIYFPNDTTANKLTSRAFFHNADEFVSDRSFKTSVPARDLKIGVADS